MLLGFAPLGQRNSNRLKELSAVSLPLPCFPASLCTLSQALPQMLAEGCYVLAAHKVLGVPECMSLAEPSLSLQEMAASRARM